jgi:hypothetical protein
MARCAYCQTETELYDGASSICVQCADLSPERRAVRAKLFGDLNEAVKRAEAANDTFVALTGGIPSGTPHPDGVQRIHNASRELSAAREEMMTAHNRLNEFVNSGIVPEDLRREN